ASRASGLVSLSCSRPIRPAFLPTVLGLPRLGCRRRRGGGGIVTPRADMCKNGGCGRLAAARRRTWGGPESLMLRDGRSTLLGMRLSYCGASVGPHPEEAASAAVSKDEARPVPLTVRA